MSQPPYQPWQSPSPYPSQPFPPTPPGAVPPPGAPGSSYAPPGSSGGHPRPAPPQTYTPPPVAPTLIAPAPRQPHFVAYLLPVSTTSEIPGRRVVSIVGQVVGTVTRPRDLQPHPELALFLTQIRQDATRAMVEMARQAGADAVIGFAYAGGAISSMSSEITAYGTAVLLEPLAGARHGEAAEVPAPTSPGVPLIDDSSDR